LIWSVIHDHPTVVLVSIGAHPASGRPRRAEQDARAVELGLQLAGDNLHVLHAGNPRADPCALIWAWGWRSCRCWNNRHGADAVPVLRDYLREAGVQLVLTGSQAETGEGSGMLPYLLAEQLGWPLMVGLAQIESVHRRRGQVLQALAPWAAATPARAPAVYGHCG
jgi:electron transfer flavoprotein beta subunit